MGLQQNYQINQKQLHSLALTQSMKQSLFMLQTNLADLMTYVQEQSMANPLFDVNPTISKQEVELATVFNNQDTEQPTLEAYLLEQIRLTMRPLPLRELVLQLIAHLDEHGYLLLSDQQLLDQLQVTPVALADAKELLYNLDPPGVGAQSLQECLILQMQLKAATPTHQLALAILEHDFDQLIAHDWSAIAQHWQVQSAQVQAAFAAIQTLTPYPYVASPRHTAYVVPELLVQRQADRLSLEVTKWGYPQIVFAQETYDQLRVSTDQATKSYVQRKYQEYQTLQKNLARRLTTLALIGRCIVSAQTPFFLQKTTTLKTLLLRDVAQKLSLSESTVSRTINDKYLQTTFGIFELKDFFTKRSNPNSELSVNEVQAQLRQLIAQEDPQHPISDQQLVHLLQAQGITIARRTVSKYRQQLGIANARQRKHLVLGK